MNDIIKDPNNRRSGKEWLSMMPKELQEKWAFYTLQQTNPTFLQFKLDETETFKNFIYGSFVAYKTDEGFGYWRDIAEGRFGVNQKKSLWSKIINFFKL